MHFLKTSLGIQHHYLSEYLNTRLLFKPLLTLVQNQFLMI